MLNCLSGAGSVTLSCYRSGQLGSCGRVGSKFATMPIDVVVVHRLIGKGSKSGSFDAVCQARSVSPAALVEFIDRGDPFLDRVPIRQKETISLLA